MEISLFTFVLYVMHVQTRFSFVLNSNSFLTLSALSAFMVEQKRKTLTLHEKVQVIKHKKKTQCGARELARVFQVGKTQIQTILKNKHGILKQFKDNDLGESKRKTGNEEINKLTWACYSSQASRLWIVASRTNLKVCN